MLLKSSEKNNFQTPVTDINLSCYAQIVPTYKMDWLKLILFALHTKWETEVVHLQYGIEVLVS